MSAKANIKTTKALMWVLTTNNNKVMVEVDGIEPTTPCLQSRCSPS